MGGSSKTSEGDAAMIKLSTGRKALSALTVAAVIGVAMTPMSASAKNWKHHGHGGYGAAAFAGGLLLGAIVANSADARTVERECWTERRKSYDGFGGVYIRKIRGCD